MGMCTDKFDRTDVFQKNRRLLVLGVAFRFGHSSQRSCPAQRPLLPRPGLRGARAAAVGVPVSRAEGTVPRASWWWEEPRERAGAWVLRE